ncbi:MAG: HAD hydrolase-like protein [Planctomycetota bacterium]
MYAVLFDIDGTLITTGGAGKVAFAETFAEDFGIDSISDEVGFAGRSDRAIALDLMRVHGVEPTDGNWARFREGYLPRLLPALQSSVGAVLPGVETLLSQLETQADVLVGLLTGNMRDGAERKLTHYRLWERFDCGGFGDVHTERELIARDAVESATAWSRSTGGAGLTGAMVIGDTVHDVRCAKAVGAVSVAVATSSTSVEELLDESPDLLLQDLTDSEGLLAAIDAAC